jgi:hypothetical protein
MLLSFRVSVLESPKIKLVLSRPLYQHVNTHLLLPPGLSSVFSWLPNIAAFHVNKLSWKSALCF